MLTLSTFDHVFQLQRYENMDLGQRDLRQIITTGLLIHKPRLQD